MFSRKRPQEASAVTTEPTPRPREARDSRIFTEGSTFAERAAQRRQWMESRGIDHTQRILLPLGKSDYRQRNLRTGAEEIVRVDLYVDRHNFNDTYVRFPNGPVVSIDTGGPGPDTSERLAPIPVGQTWFGRPESTYPTSPPDPPPVPIAGPDPRWT
jgi:hypothetical protein